MRRNAFILIGLATAILGCTAPKTVDPVGNAKRLPIGRDKSIDQDTSVANKPDATVTDTIGVTLPPSGERK